MLIVALAAVAGLLTPVARHPVLPPCSIDVLERNPEGYFWPEESIRQGIAKSALIVRATATAPGADSWSRNDVLTPRGPSVRFRIVEVLQGSPMDSTLVLDGVLVPMDDFNPGPVPYRMVRRAGQRGDCYAREYKSGAEYLLLLRRQGAGWTSSWWPLAPTNEQLRPVQDPWLAWVRATIAGSRTDG